MMTIEVNKFNWKVEVDDMLNQEKCLGEPG